MQPSPPPYPAIPIPSRRPPCCTALRRPFWPLCGIFRAGRIWVFRGEGLGDADLPPRIDCAVGPCWMMLLVTYGLVIGISLSLFSMTVRRPRALRPYTGFALRM